MDCPGCEGGLEKQVNKIPSVKSSDANWVKQELKVVVKQDSTLNIAELKKRVKKANFTLSTDAKEGENEK
jgi:copper chaperone CopZ